MLSIKNWKEILEQTIRGKTQSPEGILEVIYLCEDIYRDIEPTFAYISDQRSLVDGWLKEYRRLYIIRTGEEPPSRPEVATDPRTILDTPQARKIAVREISLALTPPGEEITDKKILDTIRIQGNDLAMENPAATISSIMNGFKLEFDKVEGKRGTFKRKELTVIDTG